MYLQFDKLFSPTVICLKLTGCFPEETRRPLWALHFGIMQGLYTLYFSMLLYSVMFHDVHDDIINLFANTSYAVVYGVISLNYYSMINYRQSFLNMMTIVKKDYARAASLTTEEQTLINDYAKQGKMVASAWAFTCFSYFTVSGIAPLLFMGYLALFSEFRLVQYIRVTLPESTDDMSPTVVNTFVVVLCTYYMFYSILIYVAVVPLGLIFMLHACGRIDILKIKVLELFHKNDTAALEGVFESIKMIAIDLQEIYEFVEDIKISTKLSYEITLKGSPVIIPVTIFLIIEGHNQGSIRVDSLCLLVGALLICSLPCYYGNMLQLKGTELREAVYFSGWEGVWERRVRSSLLVLMTRMERTIAIRSVFRVMCLDSLTDVFSQAYTLLNVLNAAWTLKQ